MADRSVSQMPAAEPQDLVDTALFHLVNTLRPDLSDQDRRATAAQIRALLVPAGAIGTSELADNGVTNAKLRDSAALSVIGRSANSAGNPGDITAATDGHVLRRSGSTVGFGQVGAAGIGAGAVGGTQLASSISGNRAFTGVITFSGGLIIPVVS